MARVIVCGGRSYNDRKRVFQVLDDAHKALDITLVVHGGASGADSIAGRWAKERGVAERVYKADWAIYGRMAGPLRNKEMLDRTLPHLVIAFEGGSGTRSMIRLAKNAGVDVLTVDE